MVSNIAPLEATVRPSAISSRSAMVIAPDTPWLSASLAPIAGGSLSVTLDYPTQCAPIECSAIQ
jgi:hypothetical protein